MVNAARDPSVEPHREAASLRLGEAAAASLGNRRVALVGCGRRGGPLALALAKAGVADLALFDRDRIRTKDLDASPFAPLHAEDFAQKVEVVADQIREAAPWCAVEPYYEEITYANALDTLDEHDLIVDATRSRETKQVLSEVALHRGCWFVTAIADSPAHWTLVAVAPPDKGRRGPCFRCWFPDETFPGDVDTVDNAGTLALEDLVVTGAMAQVISRVLQGKAEGGAWTIARDQLSVTARDEVPSPCPACSGAEEGHHFLAGKGVTYSSNLCERYLVQIGARTGLKLDLQGQADRLARVAEIIQVNRFMLVCEFEGLRISLFPNGRANVKGTKDPLQARGCYLDLLGV